MGSEKQATYNWGPTLSVKPLQFLAKPCGYWPEPMRNEKIGGVAWESGSSHESKEKYAEELKTWKPNNVKWSPSRMLYCTLLYLPVLFYPFFRGETLGIFKYQEISFRSIGLIPSFQVARPASYQSDSHSLGETLVFLLENGKNGINLHLMGSNPDLMMNFHQMNWNILKPRLYAHRQKSCGFQSSKVLMFTISSPMCALAFNIKLRFL